ncbi:MAG: HD domain-containing protein [Candidatus Omnitrophica bacterium]|nr:HD domain-containing protein [Candidatus Omnitrophota bacterium]
MLKFTSKDKDILKEIYNFAKNRRVKLYLVGGILRDLILARQKPNPDFDFAIKKGAISFGRSLANKLKAGFVVLDREHGACRIVKKTGAKIYTFDFSDFRGKNLEGDLRKRDFTINAIALELEKVFDAKDLSSALIDPYGAREDLKRKIIRVVDRQSFREDPLRILRAFSFTARLGFKIDKETLKQARAKKAKLAKVSFERVRDELFKVFDSEKAYACLAALDKLKILEIIFPEIKKMRRIGQGPYHHLDVWQHTLESVRQIELIFKEARGKAIRDFLDAYISADRSRRQLLKLAAFLHDVGKPATLRRKKGRITFHGHERVGVILSEDIARRLRLSNDELYSLRKMILCHLRPGYLADSEYPSPRARFRFFRDAGAEALAVLLLSLADQRATKGPLTTAISRRRHERVVSRLIQENLKKSKEKKKARLVNGNDIMKEFKLSPSPLIGKILAEIEELQAIGKLKTRAEALKAAARLVK